MRNQIFYIRNLNFHIGIQRTISINILPEAVPINSISTVDPYISLLYLDLPFPAFIISSEPYSANVLEIIDSAVNRRPPVIYWFYPRWQNFPLMCRYLQIEYTVASASLPVPTNACVNRWVVGGGARVKKRRVRGAKVTPPPHSRAVVSHACPSADVVCAGCGDEGHERNCYTALRN